MSSRRGFLKTGLAAAGAFAVTGPSLQAGEEPVDDGFAGTGYDYSRPNSYLKLDSFLLGIRSPT